MYVVCFHWSMSGWGNGELGNYIHIIPMLINQCFITKFAHSAQFEICCILKNLAVMMVLINAPTTRTKLVETSQHHYQLTSNGFKIDHSVCFPPFPQVPHWENVTLLTLLFPFPLQQWLHHSYLGIQGCAGMFLDIIWCLWRCGGLLLTIFLFLLQKIETTLKGVCLLLATIYDHVEYGNVHLEMTADDTLFGTLFFPPLSEEGVIHH